MPRVVDYEQRTTDVIQDRQLASSRDPVGILSVATGGDLPRSRWREIYHSHGVGDELRAACVDRYGCWAHLRLLRASDDPPFGAADAGLLRDMVPAISSALRRRIVSPVENIQAGPAEPGIVVLDSQLAVRSTFWGVRAGQGVVMEADSGGRYSYRSDGAELYDGLGIEGTTYEIGFEAVRLLMLLAPGGELAQVQLVRLPGKAAVAGEESS